MKGGYRNLNYKPMQAYGRIWNFFAKDWEKPLFWIRIYLSRSFLHMLSTYLMFATKIGCFINFEQTKAKYKIVTPDSYLY